MAEAREELVFMAKLAEKAWRYDEMVEFMEKLVAGLPEAEELTAEERILLSSANRGAIGSRGMSWWIVSSILESMERHGEGDLLTAVRDYRAKLLSEVSSICEGILRLLDTRLLPSATTEESRVFFLTMKGEYNLCLAEFKIGVTQKDAIRRAFSAYEAAQIVAEDMLAPTDPARLGLALHLSEVYFGVFRRPLTACALAEQAFDKALAQRWEGRQGLPFTKEAIFLMLLLYDRSSSWRRGM